LSQSEEKRRKMVMNAETRNGRAENNSKNLSAAENLTPESSEDETRKTKGVLSVTKGLNLAISRSRLEEESQQAEKRKKRI
jgi:hypothetical protein